MEPESVVKQLLSIQNPKQFIGNHPITDQELLFACELVTEIHDYSKFTSQFFSSILVKTSQVTANPYTPLQQLQETPRSLKLLQKTGWMLIDASHWLEIGSNNAYQGIILVNEQYRLVLLAHRGMQFTLAPNLVAALQIGSQGVPRIAEDALRMCSAAVETANQFGYELYHTGFSMGGFLAQITASYCNHSYQRHNQAICYDPPGAQSAIEKLKFNDNKKNIVIYLTSPNAVNTAAPHYGYVRQISKYQNQNTYLLSILKQTAVDQPLTIELENFFSLKTPEYFQVLIDTLKSHDQEILRKDLGEDMYFAYHHVNSWPLASNNFIQVETESHAIPSNISTAEFLIRSLASMGNALVTKKNQKITTSADMTGVNAIQHQIQNPIILYNDEPILNKATTQVPLQLVEITMKVTLAAVVIFLVQRQRQQQLQIPIPTLSDDQQTQPNTPSSSNKESVWGQQNLQQRQSPVTNPQRPSSRDKKPSKKEEDENKYDTQGEHSL